MPELLNKHENVTILIVDDDPSIILATSKALGGLGRIIFAVNGKNALEQASQEIPDVILLDAEMPEMDGFEVCTKLKAKKELAHIPVIFITSHFQPSFEAQVFDHGASDYISKPLNPRVLLARTSLQLNFKRALEKLESLSLTDSMTGLHNRRSLDDTLKLEFQRARRAQSPIALLMIDIDEFKKYNDHFGHILGDICLQQVANVLAGSAHRPTDFIARFGGEEFAIILPDTDSAGAKHFAEMVLLLVNNAGIKHAPSAGRETVTISIGCHSVIPSSSTQIEFLLESADESLYQAKKNGRNCVFSKD